MMHAGARAMLIASRERCHDGNSWDRTPAWRTGTRPVTITSGPAVNEAGPQTGDGTAAPGNPTHLPPWYRGEEALFQYRHMRFSFTDEQRQFRDMVRRFFAEQSPVAAVRRQIGSDEGFDRAVWRRMGRALALPALLVPERLGGAGFGTVEVGIVMEEMGRALYCGPYLASSVLSTAAILNCADEAGQARLLPGIAAGETIAALAAGYLPGSVVHDGETLSGMARLVVDGMAADVLLVAAADGPGTSLYEVDPAAPGFERRPLEAIDGTRRLAELRFNGVPARALGTAGDGLTRALDVGVIALANEMAGGAGRLFEDTLDYLKMRVQFGRSIASFQAIKHRCAELLLQVELAKSAAYHAAGAADEDDSQLSYHASLAKAGTAGCLHVRGRRGHTTARRHRLHSRTGHPSLVQARQVLRSAAGQPGLASRAHDRGS